MYFLAANLALIALIFFCGCATPGPNAEFVKTINFSSLDSFSYQDSLFSGLDFRESEEMLLEELSEEAVVSELQMRGFERVNEDADFFVVVEWRKAVCSNPRPSDHIDGFRNSINRRDHPSYKFSTRMNLTLEIYESSTGNLFWSNRLPNIFDTVQMTERRIVDSLRRSIENFPDCIEKDPNLPDME